MPFAAIDFGTSNSAVGVLRNGVATLLEVEPGHLTTPTALFFPHAKGAAPLLGRAAISAYLAEDPGRFMRGLKSVLGTSLFPETTSIRGHQTPFAEIIGTYLKLLLAHAQTQTESPITQVLVGRPVHFLTNEPEADTTAENQLRSILQSLGLKHIEFLPEPIAAAYHYEQSLTAEQLVLVVDIGGGTTDLTAIRLGPNHTHLTRTGDILATHGLRLGGTDIDQAFALAQVMPHLGYQTLLTGDSGEKGLTVPSTYYHQLTTWHRIHRMYEKTLLHEIRLLTHQAAEPQKLARLLHLLQHHYGHRLMFAIEAAKIALSKAPAVKLNLKWLEADLALTLTEAELAESLITWRESLADAIHETLQLAALPREKISAIFLTGGPSAMPLVQATVSQTLPGIPLIQGDQLTSVASGLTLAAARLFA